MNPTERVIVLAAAKGAIEALQEARAATDCAAEGRYFKTFAELIVKAVADRPAHEVMLLIGVAHAITTGNARQAMLMLRDGFASEIRRANGTSVSPNLN